MKRVTIADIARSAQVSRGAVSLALNNKPGVSSETRERIVAIANSLGWTPNLAARALSSSQAGAFGLVIARPRASLDSERFHFQFICGVESVLTAHNRAFVLQMVDGIDEELQVYRSWWAQHRVDAVMLIDPRHDDPRPARLREMRVPFVTIGSHLAGGASVLIDDAAMMSVALEHLAERGSNRVAYVCGFAHLQHVARRRQAFLEHSGRLGLHAQVSNPTDYSEASGVIETKRLLAQGEPPEAIIYDNEILTIGGLTALHAGALAIPEDVAVLSLEDSPVWRVLSPQITSFLRDPSLLGSTAAEILVTGGDLSARQVQLDAPKLGVRASTGA